MNEELLSFNVYESVGIGRGPVGLEELFNAIEREKMKLEIGQKVNYSYTSICPDHFKMRKLSENGTIIGEIPPNSFNSDYICELYKEFENKLREFNNISNETKYIVLSDDGKSIYCKTIEDIQLRN